MTAHRRDVKSDYPEFNRCSVSTPRDHASGDTPNLLEDAETKLCDEEFRLASLESGARTARRALKLIKANQSLSIEFAARRLRISAPAASLALYRLASLGLIKEVKSSASDRVFEYVVR